MEYTANRVAKPVTTYREVKIGRMLFRVTNEYMGVIDLKKALEDLTVSRVARETLGSGENV